MKCDKCFFCTRIGKGIYADYPVKYCKYYNKYFVPLVETQDNGGTKRRLDFNKMSDCKIWSQTGCNIHPSRVQKAKRAFIKELEEKVVETE